MEKKYEFTSETKEVNNHILHRIKALKDFGDVHKGDLGGWLEKESNLSHEGTCWVYDNAMVYDNAEVYSHARVTGDSMVYGDAWVTSSAHICDNAQVYGKASIGGNAQVYG